MHNYAGQCIWRLVFLGQLYNSIGNWKPNSKSDCKWPDKHWQLTLTLANGANGTSWAKGDSVTASSASSSSSSAAAPSSLALTWLWSWPYKGSQNKNTSSKETSQSSWVAYQTVNRKKSVEKCVTTTKTRESITKCPKIKKRGNNLKLLTVNLGPKARSYGKAQLQPQPHSPVYEPSHVC